MAGGGRRGADYDRRFAELAASGVDVHGEADLVAGHHPGSVLDAGCGTGRVAIELARRGIDVVGVDIDPSMLAAARANAPSLTWIQGDLATLDLGRTFDVVVMAGNVILFTSPGTEADVIARLARHVGVGGVLVAGFSLGTVGVDDYDAMAAAAGLTPVERWSTWTRAPFGASSDYVVLVHAPSAVPPTVPGA